MVQRLTRTPLSRRGFLALTGGLAGGVALSACGAGDSNSPASKSGVTTISVWYWDDALQLAVDAFHEKQSDIRVNFQKLAWDDVHQKLLTSLAAGSGAPDVCALDFEYLGGFSVRGGLVDLGASPYNAGEYEADMVEYKWAQATTGDGRLVAFPWDVGPGGLWYRADIFEQAGLETDPEIVSQRVQSFEDWFAIGQELRQAVPDTALVADAYNDVFYPAMLQHGQNWFDGDKVVVAEKAIQALELAKQAREMGVDADIDWWGAEWSSGLKKNAFAGMGVACWQQQNLRRTNPETAGSWRVIRTPGGDFSWGGGFLAIPEQSENKDAAWEFIKFAAGTAEGQNAIFKETGLFPAYKPAWEDPFYDQPDDFFGGQKVRRLWAESAEGSPGYSVHPSFREANEIVDAEIAKVEEEGKSPEQAMLDAEKQIVDRVPDVEA